MTSTLDTLGFEGLTIGSSQVWGAVRLFPVLTDAPIDDLRLHRQCMESPTMVTLRGHLDDPSLVYTSYVPHGFVATIPDAGEVAAYGTKLGRGSAKLGKKRGAWMHVHRMARIRDRSLQFLPLHFAMEGYLALQFGGPDVAWEEFSRRAIRTGLSPRMECSITGHAIPGLGNALRVFEIHEQQVGALLFVGDVFTSAVILPNPTDYQALHPSLLSDFFGDTLVHHALAYPEVPDWDADLTAHTVDSVQDIRDALATRQQEWSDFHRVLVRDLFDKPIRSELTNKLGRFSLRRFLPRFRLDEQNHIGEMIVDENGRLAYLKSFLLTQNQVRRGHLLSLLAAVDWHLQTAADQQGDTLAELVRRIERAGFDYLLDPEVLRRLR